MPREDTSISSVTECDAPTMVKIVGGSQGSGTIVCVPTPPESTKSSLRLKLSGHARTRWPQLACVTVRFRGGFAYVDGVLPDETVLILMRLRYNGSASRWGFAIYLASTGKYEDSMLPTGDLTGSPEDALDTACGLYLGDPTAWQLPPTN